MVDDPLKHVAGLSCLRLKLSVIGLFHISFLKLHVIGLFDISQLGEEFVLSNQLSKENACVKVNFSHNTIEYDCAYFILVNYD